MELSHRLGFALALSSMAAAAVAQDSMPAEEKLWKGFYILLLLRHSHVFNARKF